MLIIDRNEDFYDYVSHVYGVDKQIVFDRSESVNISDIDLLNMVFSKEVYNTPQLFFLEIGNYHYLIKLDNFIINEKITPFLFPTERVQSFDITIIHRYPYDKNMFNVPISIHEANNYWWFKWQWDWNHRFRDRKVKKIEIPSLDEVKRYIQLERYNKYNGSIYLPILRNTSLTKILDPFDVWSKIQNYISSLNNDKDVSIPMTDKEKAVVHGFDKHSFRHPTKLKELK